MPTSLEDLLFALEERFWLEGGDYYRGNLASAAVMVFPDPPGVLVSDEIADSIDCVARWTQVELVEHRLLELDENAAVVTDKATAWRDDRAPYVARASSAYVRDGRTWKLAFHQQTPLRS